MYWYFPNMISPEVLCKACDRYNGHDELVLIRNFPPHIERQRSTVQGQTRSGSIVEHCKTVQRRYPRPTVLQCSPAACYCIPLALNRLGRVLGVLPGGSLRGASTAVPFSVGEKKGKRGSDEQQPVQFTRRGSIAHNLIAVQYFVQANNFPSRIGVHPCSYLRVGCSVARSLPTASPPHFHHHSSHRQTCLFLFFFLSHLEPLPFTS